MNAAGVVISTATRLLLSHELETVLREAGWGAGELVPPPLRRGLAWEERPPDLRGFQRRSSSTVAVGWLLQEQLWPRCPFDAPQVATWEGQNLLQQHCKRLYNTYSTSKPRTTRICGDTGISLSQIEASRVYTLQSLLSSAVGARCYQASATKLQVFSTSI